MNDRVICHRCFACGIGPCVVLRNKCDLDDDTRPDSCPFKGLCGYEISEFERYDPKFYFAEDTKA